MPGLSAFWIPLALLAVGFAAGFVDSIAGGGGLLTLPAFLFVPQLGANPELALGTNKGQSIFGSSSSFLRYYHSPLLDKSRIVHSLIAGVIASALGVLSVLYVVPNKSLRPMVLALLIAVAIFMILYKAPSVHASPIERPIWAEVLVAFVIAFYDGFFGPGTGMFLILIYARFWNDPLDAASANAKIVNFASNLGSLITFAALGRIWWRFALPMGVGQVIGASLGAHFTIRVGRGLVRYVVICVSLALVIRLAYQIYIGG